MNIRPFIPLLISAAIVIGAGALYGLGYYSLTELEERSVSLEGDIQTKTTLLNRATRARNELSSLENQEAALNQYSVARSAVVPFLENIEASGKDLGAVVDVLSVSDQVVEGHTRISLSLSITGSFDGVMRTLGSIEYSPYDGVVESVTIDSTPGTSGRTWNAAVIYSVGLRDTTSAPKP